MKRVMYAAITALGLWALGGNQVWGQEIKGPFAGPYIGLSADMRTSIHELSLNKNDTGDRSNALQDFLLYDFHMKPVNKGQLAWGGYAGYGQIRGDLYYGVEFSIKKHPELSHSLTFTGASIGQPIEAYKEKMKTQKGWETGAGLRLGYLPKEDLMIYVKPMVHSTVFRSRIKPIVHEKKNLLYYSFTLGVEKLIGAVKHRLEVSYEPEHKVKVGAFELKSHAYVLRFGIGI